MHFTSNNGDWTKRLLNTDWSFLYFYPADTDMAGIPLEAFMEEYPFIKIKYLDTMVKEFKVNFCLIDKTVVQDRGEIAAFISSNNFVEIESTKNWVLLKTS